MRLYSPGNGERKSIVAAAVVGAAAILSTHGRRNGFRNRPCGGAGSGNRCRLCRNGEWTCRRVCARESRPVEHPRRHRRPYQARSPGAERDAGLSLSNAAVPDAEGPRPVHDFDRWSVERDRQVDRIVRGAVRSPDDLQAPRRPLDAGRASQAVTLMPRRVGRSAEYHLVLMAGVARGRCLPPAPIHLLKIRQSFGIRVVELPRLGFGEFLEDR